MALVHKVTTRNVLLLVGMSTLVLVAVTRPALTRGHVVAQDHDSGGHEPDNGKRVDPVEPARRNIPREIFVEPRMRIRRYWRHHCTNLLCRPVLLGWRTRQTGR